MLRQPSPTLLVVAGISLASVLYAAIAVQPSTSIAAGPNAAKSSPAVAVTLGVVEQKDIPIFADSVGTVAPANSVVVRSRAEGQLLSVTFVEGQMVKKGDILAHVDPAPYVAKLNEAVAQKAAAMATRANTSLELKRYEGLVAKGFASTQMLDEKRAKVAEQNAAVAEAEARIEFLRLQVANTTIRAPIAGRVGRRMLDAGNLIRASEDTALVQIVQTNPISLNFAVAARLLPEIKSAMQIAAPEVAATAMEGGLQTVGKLSLINNEIDQATSQIHLKASFENNRNALWPGQLVNVKLNLGMRKNALVVAPAAVQTGPNGRYVYVVRKDQTVERRPVELLAKDSTWAVIGKGVLLGEKVVVDGYNKIEEGSKVSG